MEMATKPNDSVDPSDGSDTVVAGFGSPHGDDQAGWMLIAKLSRHPNVPARLVTVSEGTQLVDELEHCRKLIVIDACRSGGPLGRISRFFWPDPRIQQHHNHSTHGIGLSHALELAERLGRIPPEVEVLGIEMGSSQPIGRLSCEVMQALDELEAIILAELDEVCHA